MVKEIFHRVLSFFISFFFPVPSKVIITVINTVYFILNRSFSELILTLALWLRLKHLYAHKHKLCFFIIIVKSSLSMVLYTLCKTILQYNYCTICNNKFMILIPSYGPCVSCQILKPTSGFEINNFNHCEQYFFALCQGLRVKYCI